MAPNRYPIWKNLLIIVVLLIAFLYALPNIYGTDPAVQISATDTGVAPDQTLLNTIEKNLAAANIHLIKVEHQPRGYLLRFDSTDIQFRAKEIIQQTVGNNALVALNLAATTPDWLTTLHAAPMKLGLDLRGGLHFLMQVDLDSVAKQHMTNAVVDVGSALRAQRIRYIDLRPFNNSGITLKFQLQTELDKAKNLLTRQFIDFVWNQPQARELTLQGMLSPRAIQTNRQQTLEQNMTTLRNRVNELGVSEAIVQQQGASRIAIDLPGIQDTAEAQSILGKTTTLEFHLVDSGNTPTISSTPYPYNGSTLRLQDPVILRGSAITNASAITGDDGRPAVSVRLGSGETLFAKTTAENIGHNLVILSADTKSDTQTIDGKKVITYTTDRHVISSARIDSALGNAFQITGLSSQQEASTLALLLRAGALVAPVTIIESAQIGPNLGAQNIHKGELSVAVGFCLVVLFMTLYYRGMGLIANAALAANLILIVAILSLLGATLTLPGIAGMVLTMGMAVDANVLIFERIREELRNKASVQASIQAGYDRAFVTIIDANVATLIVAVVLFSLGQGTVKNFAITLTIGLMTSMFTAITGTRAIVNWLYGNRPGKAPVKKISIGM